jgi:hypothetical protein
MSLGEILEIASWVETPLGAICAVAFVAACFFYGRWVLTDKPKKGRGVIFSTKIEFEKTRSRALLNRSRENQDIDAFGAPTQQRARRGVGGCPRGHDVVDKDNRAGLDPRRHPFGHLKRTLHIERPNAKVRPGTASS